MTQRPTPDSVPDGFSSNDKDPAMVPRVEPEDLDLPSVMEPPEPRRKEFVTIHNNGSAVTTSVLTQEEVNKMTLAARELLWKMDDIDRGMDRKVYGSVKGGALYVLEQTPGTHAEQLDWRALPAKPAVPAPPTATVATSSASVTANGMAYTKTPGSPVATTTPASGGFVHAGPGAIYITGTGAGTGIPVSQGGSGIGGLVAPTPAPAAPTVPIEQTQINFRASPHLKQLLKVGAAKAGLSMADFLSKIVRERLDELQMDEDIATGSETFTFEIDATKTPAAEDHQATMDLLRSILVAKGYKVGKTLVSVVESDKPVIFGPAPLGTYSASKPPITPIPTPVIAGAGLVMNGNTISLAPTPFTGVACGSCNSTKSGMHLQGCPSAPCVQCGYSGYHAAGCSNAPCPSCQMKGGGHHTYCSANNPLNSPFRFINAQAEIFMMRQHGKQRFIDILSS